MCEKQWLYCIVLTTSNWLSPRETSSIDKHTKALVSLLAMCEKQWLYCIVLTISNWLSPRETFSIDKHTKALVSLLAMCEKQTVLYCINYQQLTVSQGNIQHWQAHQSPGQPPGHVWETDCIVLTISNCLPGKRPALTSTPRPWSASWPCVRNRLYCINYQQLSPRETSSIDKHTKALVSLLAMCEKQTVLYCINYQQLSPRETSSIDKHTKALVSLLAMCQKHRLAQANKDEDPPHAKIASDIMSCLFMVSPSQNAFYLVVCLWWVPHMCFILKVFFVYGGSLTCVLF